MASKFHSGRTEARRHSICYHEAGHAVVAWALGLTIKHIDATFDKPHHEPTESFAEICARMGEVPANRAMAAISHAGNLAQNKKYPESAGNGDPTDFFNARNCEQRIMELTGEKDAHKTCSAESARLIDQHWHCIVALADALVDKPKMAGAEATAIISGAIPS